MESEAQPNQPLPSPVVQESATDAKSEINLSDHLEGSVLNVDPGFVYNAWADAYLKWLDEKPVSSLYIYKDKNQTEIIDKISQSELKFIEPSDNPLVFVVYLKQISPKTQKKEFYFKVLTNKEERDAWVSALKPKVPVVTPQVKVVDLTGFELKGKLQQIFLGIIYNSWRDVFAEFDEKTDSLNFYENETKAKFLEGIVWSKVESIRESTENKFGFTINLQGGNKVYLKTVSTEEDRNKWVYSLHLKTKHDHSKASK